MHQTEVYIGLGSNIEDRFFYLTEGLKQVAALKDSQLKAYSQIYQTPAFGPPQNEYLNACACLKTSLTPISLLKSLQEIETQLGRKRIQRWGPRTLDLDILLYGNVKIQTSLLTIPHPEMHLRASVLVPLLDLIQKYPSETHRITFSLKGISLEGVKVYGNFDLGDLNKI